MGFGRFCCHLLILMFSRLAILFLLCSFAQAQCDGQDSCWDRLHNPDKDISRDDRLRKYLDRIRDSDALREQTPPEKGREHTVIPEGGTSNCVRHAIAALECVSELQSTNSSEKKCGQHSAAHWQCVRDETKNQPHFNGHAGYSRVKRGRHGYMAYSPFDIYFSIAMELYGEWAQIELDVMKHFVPKGGTVLEAGTHIGSLSVPLAQMLGPAGLLVGFEPQLMMYRFCNANLALNGLWNARLIHAAAGYTARGDTATVVRYSPDDMRNLGGVQLNEHENEENSFPVDIVDVIEVDSLNLGGLDFVKLDCEGFEDNVIMGAQSTIASFLPAMYVEAPPSPDPRKCGDGLLLLHSLQYKCWHHVSTLYNPDNYFHEKENFFQTFGVPTVSSMLLCLPPRWLATHAHVPIEAKMNGFECIPSDIRG